MQKLQVSYVKQERLPPYRRNIYEISIHDIPPYRLLSECMEYVFAEVFKREIFCCVPYSCSHLFTMIEVQWISVHPKCLETTLC